jgi:hypothetical protein
LHYPLQTVYNTIGQTDGRTEAISGGFEMGELWWIIPAAVLFMLAVLVWRWSPLRTGRRAVRFAEARRDFHRQRERLEAKFLHLGMNPGRRDAPHWTDCEFEDDVAYARNRVTGELSAFVAVTIAIEELDAQGYGSTDTLRSLRAATAVFRFDGDHWETDGRAIFNKSPTEAIRFYHRDLELLVQEVAEHR